MVLTSGVHTNTSYLYWNTENHQQQISGCEAGQKNVRNIPHSAIPYNGKDHQSVTKDPKYQC